jgi:beta-glucosidase
MWGATLSAHGAEGGHFASDWWRWEQRPGRVRDGATSQEAAQHWDRAGDDLRLAARLGHNAHLFSLEWSRIEPEPGKWDESALQHYAGRLALMAELGIEPVCALQQTTLPMWLAERGGWASRHAPQRFARYAARVAGWLATDCRWWIPVLDPMHTVSMGYGEGAWPPGRRNALAGARALMHLAAAHRAGARAIKEAAPGAQVGAAIRARRFEPLDPESTWDLQTAERETHRATHGWLEGLLHGRWPWRPFATGGDAPGVDFVGAHYEGVETLHFDVRRPNALFVQRTTPQGSRVAHLAVEERPEELGVVLGELSRYGKPLLVTGCGIATDDEDRRRRFLAAHVKVAEDAAESGMDLRGFFYHSLLDEFAWHEGYRARYGLVRVDRDTFERSPTPAAYIYRDLARRRAKKRKGRHAAGRR